MLRQPPAACTAVVDAPGRTSSEASLRRPECDGHAFDFEAERGGQDLQAAVDLVRAERHDAVGRGGRRAQVLDGAGEGSGEQPQVLGAAVGVGLRDPHADPARRAPAA